jgi:hypothetical protein
VTALPRRNEDRFYRYPKNRVVAIIADDAHLSAALRDVKHTGASVSDVNALSGTAGAHLLDRTGTGYGLHARLLRAFQPGAYEVDALRAHEQALQGRTIRRVRAGARQSTGEQGRRGSAGLGRPLPSVRRRLDHQPATRMTWSATA